MSRRRKIRPEEKIQIVKGYLDGEIGICAAVEQLGVHFSVIYDWVRLYQMEGVTAFLPGRENRRYTPETKEAAVKEYLAGAGSLSIPPRIAHLDRLN